MLRPRYRQRVIIDHDAVSPDSIPAAVSFSVGALTELAARDGNVLDWNTVRIYSRAKRENGDLVIITYGRALKP